MENNDTEGKDEQLKLTDDEMLWEEEWARNFDMTFFDTDRLADDLRIKKYIEEKIVNDWGEEGFKVGVDWEDNVVKAPDGTMETVRSPVVVLVERISPLDKDNDEILMDSDVERLKAHGVDEDLM